MGGILLRKAFAIFGDRGVNIVELDVDSENQTGATALYEHLGMSQALSYVFYDKKL